MKVFILFSFLLLTACTNHANELTLDKGIDGLFAAYQKGIRPGFAIGVMDKEAVVYARGFGYADIENKQPIDSNTSFNLASVSKQFTAASIALEIQNGTLKLDDKLSAHWQAAPPFMSEIELGHLVYMTSGLSEYYTLPSPKGGWQSENRFTVDDAISAVLASKKLEYTPGTRWSYSNINYQILTKVIQQNTNQPFSKYMQDKVFTPLDMQNAWIDAPIQTDRSSKANAYVWSMMSWREAPRLSPHYGGSGMYASLNDLFKWNKALYHTNKLGEQFNRIMLSTRKYQHDKTNDAFGLVYGNYMGRTIIWYEGGDYGVSTYMVHLPELDKTIICLSNFADGQCGSKTRAIMDLIFAIEALLDVNFSV